ncbi:MAG: hypothetical protein K5919_05155 [Clostridiales bacterium]|nr:hypothetical protein [Clostridiales bacterium]
MNTTELIKGLRDLAAFGIVNHKRDNALLEEAADRLEEMDERIAIIGEPGAVLISRKLTAQEREAVWEAFRSNSPIYASIERMGDQFSIQSLGPLRVTEDEEKRFCGLIEEE